MPLDTLEFPGMTCTWNPADETIDRIDIRSPIAFPAGSKDQRVRYRFFVEHADTFPLSGASYTVLHRGPWRTAVASPTSSAVFPKQTYQVAQAVDDHPYWRVRIVTQWLTGGDRSGFATHWVRVARRKGIDPGVQDLAWCSLPA
jgi:hypothetical protein